MMQRLFSVVALIAATLVGVSYAGALHPLGDSFAVFRYPLVCVGVACCAVLYRAPLARVGLVVGLGLLGARLWMGVAGAGVAAPEITIYQKNMLYRDYDSAALVEDILASGADVVTLQEVSRAHRDILSALADTHPHHLVCDGTAVGAVVVLSALPSVHTTCSDPAGIAVMDVGEGSAALRVVSLHLHWPWPYRQAEGLTATLDSLSGTVLDRDGRPPRTVVGGDFNMVPWGHSLRRVERAFGVRRIGHVERTFSLHGWPFVIDHVMASHGSAGIDVRPRLGSDHFGVVGRIDFNAP